MNPQVDVVRRLAGEVSLAVRAAEAGRVGVLVAVGPQAGAAAVRLATHLAGVRPLACQGSRVKVLGSKGSRSGEGHEGEKEKTHKRCTLSNQHAVSYSFSET